ncbi:Trp biosynthesis protein [Pseudofrankia sp. EUN1h]|nr:Trp biosynthesis protein [Pseudofrankia sp. EUN1h]
MASGADADAAVRMHVRDAAGGLPAGRPGLAGRAGLGAAVLACLVGAGLVLFASSATWARTEVRDATTTGGGAVGTPLAVALGGGDLAPAVSALGLVGLAAAVALVATRGAGRRVVGVLVALAGVGVVVLAARIGVTPEPAVRAARHVVDLAPSGHPRIGQVRLSAAPWAAALGGLAFVGAGLVAVVFGPRWPGMGGRYHTRAPRPLDDWDAIERGQDPTASADSVDRPDRPDQGG